MVIYEVNIDVTADIEEEYITWLREHVRILLREPGFLGADLFVVDNENEFERRFSVRYRLVDAHALDSYLQRSAAAFRQEGIERFGARARVTRRILTHTQRF